MNIVKTTAPVSIENLKKYFTDKTTFFIIEYKESSLKGAKLLTYLSNLDIPCDVNLGGCSNEECYEFIKDYLNSSMIVNINSLEHAVTSILLQRKGLAPLLDEQFIKDNSDIIDKWISKLESLTLYNMHIINNDSLKGFIDTFEVDETTELTGVNFISLLKNDYFYSFYENTTTENLKFYTHYFNDYMFKGKNIYSYWANENNPLFLLTFGIAEGVITAKDYISATEQSLEELANAAPV